MSEVPGVQPLLDFLLALPALTAYALITAGSALENIFPPVPSDTFVVLGAVLADRGSLQPLPVLLCAWIANSGGAMVVFGLARRRGRSAFETRWGRRLLRPHQFERLSGFYERHGLWAILLSPAAFRSCAWSSPPSRGSRDWARCGRWPPWWPRRCSGTGSCWREGCSPRGNVDRLLELLGQVNAWLLVVAVILIGAIVTWWIRSRREEDAS